MNHLLSSFLPSFTFPTQKIEIKPTDEIITLLRAKQILKIKHNASQEETILWLSNHYHFICLANNKADANGEIEISNNIFSNQYFLLRQIESFNPTLQQRIINFNTLLQREKWTHMDQNEIIDLLVKITKNQLDSLVPQIYLRVICPIRITRENISNENLIKNKDALFIVGDIEAIENQLLYDIKTSTTRSVEKTSATIIKQKSEKRETLKSFTQRVYYKEILPLKENHSNKEVTLIIYNAAVKNRDSIKFCDRSIFENGSITSWKGNSITFENGITTTNPPKLLCNIKRYITEIKKL